MGPGVVMGEGDRMVVMVMSVRMNIFLPCNQSANSAD
jgi:hypothetical protein